MINQEDILYGKISIAGKPILDCEKLLIDVFNKTVVNVKLPIGIKKIPEYAFSNCLLLTSITFKETPDEINETAFKGCSSLKDIYVPWSEGEVANAPWGATNATINYNYNPT